MAGEYYILINNHLSTWKNLISTILNAKMQRHKVTKNLNFASFRLCGLAFKI